MEKNSASVPGSHVFPTTAAEPENSVSTLSKDSDVVPSPDPISYVFPMAIVEPEDCPESSTMEHPIERKQREALKSILEKSWRVSFRLLQCEGLQETYILEMHEVESGNISIHQLAMCGNEMKVKALSHEKRILHSPVVHIINRLHVPKRSKLSPRQRLGKWKMEQWKYNDSERRDKCYRHQNVPNKKFRSINEVAIFILYNCYREDMKEN